MNPILQNTHINAPFPMLADFLLDRFIASRMNPEIGISAAAMDEFDFGEFERVSKELAAGNIRVTIHGPFADLSPGSADSEIRKLTVRRFEQLLSLIPLFKPKTVVCHAGYDWKRYVYFREEWIENSLKIWSWLGKRLRDEGSRLMLENVYEEDPEELRVLLENLAEQDVGLCFDIGHQNVFGKTPLEKWLESVGPYIGQIHLHDNHGKRDEHLGLGMGTIDFQPLFDYLKKRNEPFPVITLEPHRKEAVRPCLAYLEKHLG